MPQHNAGRYEGFGCLGGGDVTPTWSWQDLRKVPSEIAIGDDKKINPELKNTRKNLSSKTFIIRGENIYRPSSPILAEKITSDAMNLRDGGLYNDISKNEARRFCRVLDEPSTPDEKKLGNENEDISECDYDKEEISDYCDDLDLDLEDQESLKVFSNYVNPIQRNKHPPERKLNSGEQAEVKVCPWKKLSLFLLTFSLASFMFLLLLIDTFDLDLFYLKSFTCIFPSCITNLWKEREIVKKVPSFAKSFREMFLNKKYLIENIPSKENILGVVVIVITILMVTA